MRALASKHPQATQLLHHVLSTPDLVATVQALPPERLSALVHGVGLEDAGELVALATTSQLEALFDDDLWKSGDAAEERFDSERFVLWLEVLWEAGEAAVVKRLTELPREFVCFAVATLAYVLDTDALVTEVEMSDRYRDRLERALELASTEEWEEFMLVDRGRGGFEVLMTSLIALDTEHAPVLRAILERCYDLSSAEVAERGGLVKALNRLEAAEEAARGERQERRTQRGFVSLADARSFWTVVESGASVAGRDPVTHAYFRDVYGKQRARRDQSGLAADRLARRLSDVVNGDASGDPAHEAGAQAAVPRRVMDATKTLSEALELLRERDAISYEHRVTELVYLANVLVTLSEPAVRRLRPIEASEAALRVCAEGIVALGLGESGAAELSVTLEQLLLDLAFRAGWPRAMAASASEPLLALLAELAPAFVR